MTQSPVAVVCVGMAGRRELNDSGLPRLTLNRLRQNHIHAKNQQLLTRK